MRVTRSFVLLAVLLLAACSGNSGSGSPTTVTPTAPSPPSSPAPPAPPSSPPPPQPAIVSITASGFSPSEVTTTVGSRVTFVNNDSRPHDLLGGPDHTRPDCPEVDVVGFLVTGQSRETRIFETARTCEFHDHNNVGNPAFQGRIIVR